MRGRVGGKEEGARGRLQMPCEKVRRKRVENAAILRGSRRPWREAEEASGCTLPSLEKSRPTPCSPGNASSCLPQAKRLSLAPGILTRSDRAYARRGSSMRCHSFQLFVT